MEQMSKSLYVHTKESYVPQKVNNLHLHAKFDEFQVHEFKWKKLDFSVKLKSTPRMGIQNIYDDVH